MATYKYHVEQSKVDSSGNVHILYPKNTLEDVYISSTSSSNIANKINFSGKCDTAADTAAKVVTGTGLTTGQLVDGLHVTITFTYAVPANATLNIDSTGAKSIYRNGSAITASYIKANSTVSFMYDGTRYNMIGVDTDTNTTYSAATTSAQGLMSAADKTKLDGIATGANKYSHPSYTAKSSGLYKVTVDASGHVSAATAVAKADITGLGIPGSDTNTTYSAATTSAAGLMSASDKTAVNKIGTIESSVNTLLSNWKSGTALGGSSTPVYVSTDGKLTSCGTFASSSHNHDSSYAAKSHTHDYAASNHNHSTLYAPIGKGGAYKIDKMINFTCNSTAGGNGYTHSVSFGKTYGAAPVIIAQATWNGNMFSVGVNNITTTGCSILIRNNTTTTAQCGVYVFVIPAC